MRWLADVVYLLAGLLYLPVAVYQALVLGKNRRGWGERLGFVRRFGSHRLETGATEAGAAVRRVWIHGVSLGEINATPRLVEALQQRDADLDIVVSTTTDTGYARAVQLYGVDRVFRFPLDFSPVVSRVLRRVNPSLILLVELEVWYNLVRMATRRGIPLAVVNGRLTERSARRLRRLGPISRSMFADLAWVGAQDATIASRFQELGVPADRVEVTSSLKWDTADVSGELNGVETLARAVGIDGSRPVWVCGSSGPGEEALLLDAYRRLLEAWEDPAPPVEEVGRVRRPDMPHRTGGIVGSMTRPTRARIPSFRRPILVIVPRKPERFDEVARLIEGAGFTCLRRSRQADGTATPALSDSSVILGDTMGELRKFYSLADVVFVGRSLVPMGGSDPMEVAALGKPIVVGPHTENFRLPIDVLGSAGALRVVQSADALPDVVGALLRDRAVAEELGRKARQTVIDNQGATERTVDAVVRLLQAG